MRIVIYLLTLYLVVFSCKKSLDKRYTELIIGDWRLENAENIDQTKVDTEIWSGNARVEFIDGYEFKPNGVSYAKPGFFQWGDEEYIKFAGRKTKYQISGDSLKIFNLVKKIWDRYQVISLTDTVLVLNLDDKKIISFKRKNYPREIVINFDKIIVSSSGCIGSCPISNIEMSSSGAVLYYGIRHNKYNGFFSSLISREEFQNIQENFRKSGINHLRNKYHTELPDDNTISVSFIKGDKIYKTISDYGEQSPLEFYWAYKFLTYYDQQLSLKREKDKRIPFSRLYRFDKGKMTIMLGGSEAFYLLNLLEMAKETDVRFIPKFTLYGSNFQLGINSIKTDGRYYMVPLANNKYITLDLGYDFLMKNDLIKRFSNRIILSK